jgi:hypothetical protein
MLIMPKRNLNPVTFPRLDIRDSDTFLIPTPIGLIPNLTLANCFSATRPNHGCIVGPKLLK